MNSPTARQRAPIGVAVIGLGFGQVHVSAFRRDPRCDVVALCATREDRLRELSTQLGVPRAELDWRRLLSQDDIHLVTLAVPAPLQEEIGRAALAAGKHVFFEKPLATTLAGANELVRLARANSCYTAVNFEFPELPLWHEAKRLVETQRVGALRHVAVTWRVETYSNRMRLDGWKACSGKGGGTLNLFTSHCFHYLEWLFGPMHTLYADLARAPSDPREGDTLNTIVLKSASGLSIFVTVATDVFHGSGHRLEIAGDAGTIVLENRDTDYASGFKLFVADREQREFSELVAADLRATSNEDGRVGATAAIARRLLDSIIVGDSICKPGIYEGQRVQELIDAAQRSSQDGAATKLSTRHEPRSE